MYKKNIITLTMTLFISLCAQGSSQTINKIIDEGVKAKGSPDIETDEPYDFNEDIEGELDFYSLEALLDVKVNVTSPGSYSEMPINIQTHFAIKILEFDKNIKRFGSPVKIGVTSDALLNAFRSVSAFTIAGRPLIVSKMSSPDEIINYKVIFIDKNWRDNYSIAGQLASGKKILMFCSEESGVKNNRAGISFKLVNGRPKILTNESNIEKQGSKFPKRLIQMTIPVK